MNRSLSSSRSPRKSNRTRSLAPEAQRRKTRTVTTNLLQTPAAGRMPRSDACRGWNSSIESQHVWLITLLYAETVWKNTTLNFNHYHISISIQLIYLLALGIALQRDRRARARGRREDGLAGIASSSRGRRGYSRYASSSERDASQDKFDDSIPLSQITKVSKSI